MFRKLLFCLFGIVAFGCGATAQPVPQFRQYVAEGLYHGPRSEPDLSTRDAYNYRSRLRDAAHQPANFAGHFRVVTWGCGTSCLHGAIVDLISGQVTFFPFSICCSAKLSEPGFSPVEFRPNSRLIVFSGLRGEEQPDAAHFYEFTGARFRFVGSSGPFPPSPDGTPLANDAPLSNVSSKTSDKAGCWSIADGQARQSCYDGKPSPAPVASSTAIPAPSSIPDSGPKQGNTVSMRANGSLLFNATPQEQAPTREIPDSNAATIESDAIISPQFKGMTVGADNEPVVNFLARLVRTMGHRCDTVSFAHEYYFSKGSYLFCNHQLYKYEIADNGGSPTVTEINSGEKTTDNEPPNNKTVEGGKHLDPNNWNDVIAMRVAAGAKTIKECPAGTGYCITITTSPADEYGTIRDAIEYTGTVTEQWECTVDKATKWKIRLCGTFWPARWRAEKRNSDGQFAVFKTGTIEEVYDALGWRH